MRALVGSLFRFVVFITMVSLLTVGCAGTRQFVSKPTEADLSDSSVLVHAERRSSYYGMACGLEVRDNEKTVGVLGLKGQLEWVRSPGTMRIDVRDTLNNISFRPLVLETEPGHRYELILGYPFTLTWIGETSNKYAVTLSKVKRFHSVISTPSEQAITAMTNTKSSTRPLTKPLKTTGNSLRSAYGHCYALIIGNGDYIYISQLNTPLNNARTIANVLHKYYGFNVKTLYNVKRADIIHALTSLRSTLSENDNLLIFYAGHGWLDTEADTGYWLPIDASKDDSVNWISHETITSSIRAMRAKHVIVLADSCYSGKLTRGLQVKKVRSDGLSEIAYRRARIVISSGGLEPVFDGGTRENHSVFAGALINILRENLSVLDAAGLFSTLRKRVTWNADQVPEYGVIHKTGHAGGDFLFIPSQLSSPNVPNN